MSLRISTAGLADNMMTQMQDLRSRVAATQEQISSGVQFTNAKDNPMAAGAAVALDRTQAEYVRFGKNADVLNGRLSLQESTLGQVGDILSRIRELAVQGNNATLDQTSRGAIVSELGDLKQSLLAAANTTDGQGSYLFSGTSGNAPPFVQQGSQVVYNGDQGQRQIGVAPGTTVADTDPGSEVFMRIRAGNGVAAARAGASNTGTAVIAASGFTDQSQWDGGSYTVSFNAGNYQVTDASSTVVASGAFTAGQAISFRGYQLTLNGQPATGDSFTVTPAPAQDVFGTVDNMIAALQMPDTPVSAGAARQNRLYTALEDIAAAADHIGNVRAATGTRMTALDVAATERDSALLNTRTTLSQLKDLDYAGAMTRLATESAALQASQQTFTKVQALSLFDFLR